MGMTENKAYAERQYYIERPRLELDLSCNLESEDRAGPFIATKYLSHALNERLDIETKGWVYHPAVLLYSLRLSPEWQQTIEKPDAGRETTKKSFLLGYSIDMTFLRYKPYTLNLFGRRNRSVLTNSFGGRSEAEGDTYGATLTLKYKALPATLAYVHATSDQTGFFESKESRDDIRLYMRHKEKSNDTSLNATYAAQERTTLGTAVRAKSLSSGLQNIYRITPDDKILLNSGLLYRRSESDFFSASGVSLSESLNWIYTKNFSANYNINYSMERSGDFHSDSKSAGAGLSHSLYENLATTASVSASDSRSTGAGGSSYGGNLNFDYRRSIPYGMLYINIGHDYRVTNRSVSEAFLQVIDESHVLNTGDVTSLNNQNVDLSSIVVTNADHTIVYIKDMDYTVETIGTFVRLSRTSFGAIADGAGVSARYTYLSNPAFDSSIFGRSYGVGLNLWSALRINYRYSHSQENFLSGIPPDALGNDTTQTVDTELEWKWSATMLLYEDSERTSGVSVSRWLADENLKFRLRDNLFLGISGNYGETKLKDRNETEKFYGFRSNLQWRFSRWAGLRLEGSYSRVNGISKMTVDKGGSALVEWFYGIWNGDVSYRFVNQDDLNSGQSLDRHSILFRVKRAIF